LETGHCWLKLAALYEWSKSGAPAYADVAKLAKIVIRHAPDRVIWASNWPHAQAHLFGCPDDGALMDLLLDWRKVLAQNAAELHGF
jgi:D-galactarolactone isomerase